MQHSVHYICRHSFTHACTCRHTNTHTLVTIHILSSVVHHTPYTHTYTHTKTRTDTQTPTTCTCNYIYQSQTDNVVDSSVCGPCPHALGESLVCNNACGPIGSKVPVIYLYLYCPQLDLIMWPPFKGWASSKQQDWWSHCSRDTSLISTTAWPPQCSGVLIYGPAEPWDGGGVMTSQYSYFDPSRSLRVRNSKSHGVNSRTLCKGFRTSDPQRMWWLNVAILRCNHLFLCFFGHS